VNKTLRAPTNVATELTADFWAQLLQDESMKPLSNLERLVTGCEIIAALDDLQLLADAA
jgi:hypothetical protein